LIPTDEHVKGDGNYANHASHSLFRFPIALGSRSFAVSGARCGSARAMPSHVSARTRQSYNQSQQMRDAVRDANAAAPVCEETVRSLAETSSAVRYGHVQSSSQMRGCSAALGL